MDLVTKLEKAAQVYDREATEQAAANLVAYIRGHGPWPDERALRKALTALRDNRWFGSLQSIADAIIHAGDTRPAVRRLYAQALIDRGAIAGAIAFLQRLEKECRGDADEYDEARGLIGRAWKQAYVNSDGLTKARGKELLEHAIDAYYTTWRQRKKLWHGVNALALLARAADDGIRVSGRFPDRRDLAQTILDGVKALDAAATPWDYATAAEACVGLRRWKEALLWLEQYVRRTSAFAIAGTLRQFTEVWRLSPEDERGGAALVHLLRAEMLKKPGGEDVDLGGGAATSVLQGTDDLLQAVLGEDGYVSVEWYRVGLERSRAVARIGLERSQGVGTGFLLLANDLEPSLRGQVLITNHHVIPGLIPHDRAVVTFEALDGGKKAYGIRKVLWSSPVEKLDCAIVRLSSHVKGIEPYPMCADVPELERSRVYLIGHPLGQTLSFSISDNVLIDYVDPKVQYRAPTSPGSSGSPVFDSTWALLALHHAGHEANMPKLRGNGVHAANEGLSFAAIAKQCAADLKKKKKR